MAPPLRGIRHRMDETQILSLWKTGRGLMPPMPVPEELKRPLLDFLLALDRPNPPADPKRPPRYAFGHYHPLIDQEGYPGIMITDTDKTRVAQAIRDAEAKTSGEIVLKTEEIDIDTWLSALTQLVAAQAERSERTRQALQQIVLDR